MYGGTVAVGITRVGRRVSSGHTRVPYQVCIIRRVRIGDARDGTRVAVVLSTTVLPDPARGPDNVLVSFTDIRRVREVEQAVNRSEARYRLVTEPAGDVIWTVDRADAGVQAG